MSGEKVMTSYRTMLFAFLGDVTLTKAQRGVGVCLILRTDGFRKFRTSKRPVDWGKISLLSGYEETTAKATFNHLVKVGWLEKLDDGGYQVAPAKYEAAVRRQKEHNARLREAWRERRRETAQQTAEGLAT